MGQDQGGARLVAWLIFLSPYVGLQGIQCQPTTYPSGVDCFVPAQ